MIDPLIAYARDGPTEGLAGAWRSKFAKMRLF
jgi:hypothetical protein